MLQLKLYTTEGCHLCEQAEQLLEQLNEQFPLRLELIDISADAELVERYGIRIPVVMKPASDAELGWPFDFSQLQTFVAAGG